MKDIVSGIKDVQEGQWINERMRCFTQETTISREYFNHEILSKYPNLEFIRILMNKSTLIPTFHETLRDEEYYLYSVFIDKNLLEYMSDDIQFGNLNGEKVINLSESRWERQVELRNKILKACPIIMAECHSYSDDFTYFFGKSSIELSKNISIYPHNFKIDGYELLNSTNFILISNSLLVSQRDLDDLCLKTLEKLSKENQKVIDDKKEIYLSISRKLKRNRVLSQEEREILEDFLNSEMARIEKENTLLIRSRSKSKKK